MNWGRKKLFAQFMRRNGRGDTMMIENGRTKVTPFVLSSNDCKPTIG